MRPEMAIALGMWMSALDMECPTCGEPCEIDGGVSHRECLRQRCGGEIPEDMERLIKAFKLDAFAEVEEKSANQKGE